VLVKNKAFAAVAVLTLALGIGANTAIFSVVNAAILRPMPYPDPARLMILWGNVKRARVERRGASYPDFRDWRDQSRSFEGMAAYEDNQFALTGIDNPERIPGEFVSQPYFSLLGIHAALGRTFTPDEDRIPQRNRVVVLSDGMWRRRFGGDPGILGRAIQLDGQPYTIIGVAPPGFRGLTDQADLWAPFVMSGSAEELGGAWHGAGDLRNRAGDRRCAGADKVAGDAGLRCECSGPTDFRRRRDSAYDGGRCRVPCASLARDSHRSGDRVAR
jgi:hypothetical protein